MSNRLITDTDNFSSWKTKFNAEINNQTNNYFMESALEHSGLDFVVQEGYIREGPDTSYIAKTTVTLADNASSLVCVDASIPGSEVITSFVNGSIPARDVFPLYEVTTVSGVQTVVTDKRTWLDMTVMKVHQHVEDFNTRYLGAQATPPALDNNGDPIVVGAMIYETTVGEMIIYNGSTWEYEAPAGTGTVFPTQYLKVGYNFVRTDLNRTYVLTDLAPTWFELVGVEDVTNLPVCRPSLMLDLINGGILTPKATFTRPTVGTVFDALGVMRTVAVDTPRFDHDPVTGEPLGILFEGQRTNLMTNSTDFTTGWSNGGGILSDTDTAPDGTTTADTINDTVDHQQQAVVSAGSVYTASIFAKGSGTLVLGYQSVTGTERVRYDCTLSTGAIVLNEVVGGTALSGKSVYMGNGWYRFTITASLNTVTSAGVYLAGVVGQMIWGAQLELGKFATSFIYTTSTSVQRGSDTCNITDISKYFNATVGGVYVEFDAISYDQTYSRVFQFMETTDIHRGLSVELATNAAKVYYRDSGGVSSSIHSVAKSDGDRTKVAVGYTVGGDVNTAFDGVPDSTPINPYTSESVSGVSIGGVSDTSSTLNGHIKKFSLYTQELGTNTLIELTK